MQDEFPILTDEQAYFIDEDWSGSGWKPSEIIEIRYCMLASNGFVEQAEDALSATINRARDLWRDGYFANPYAKTPVLRPKRNTFDA